MNIPSDAKNIMQLLLDAGASDALVVGGWVRDFLMEIPSKDIDIEIYGMSLKDISDVLETKGYRVDMVGQAFGVLKVNQEIDISVPRRESKTGIGHKGFDVEFDPDMTFEEACKRRDFTINAMGMRLDGTIVDPYGGHDDLCAGWLQPVSSAFSEDPLRVLRGMQFAARFNMYSHCSLDEIAHEIVNTHDELPKERIWEEWKKWAVKGRSLCYGLDFLEHTGWLINYPEINNLKGVPQDPVWHPEGPVDVHTKMVVDQAAEIAVREQLNDDDRLILIFAALCHDFGKPSTTQMIDGRWRASGHCEAGLPLVDSFMERIGAPAWLTDAVKELTADHLVHAGAEPTPRAVRRLANRLKHTNIRMLDMLVEADASGRYPLPPARPMAKWVEAAESMNISQAQPEPILMGRHLIEMGLQPGPLMGLALRDAFQAQLDGEFTDLQGAKDWYLSDDRCSSPF